MKDSYKACFETAVILAGGKSKRMGFDKQLLEKDHKRLTVSLAESLEKIFDQVYVVTNTPELYEGLSVRTCSDIYPGQGPLAGIHSAFKASGSEFLFVIACDMTVVSPDLIRYQAARFSEASNSTAEACIICPDGKMEPFHGFYRRSLLADIERRLQGQRNSLTGMLMDHEILRISREEAEEYADLTRLFRNINTPGDYKKYLETEAKQ